MCPFIHGQVQDWCYFRFGYFQLDNVLVTVPRCLINMHYKTGGI